MIVRFYIDEYGVKFSADRTELIKCNTELTGEYNIPNGVTSIDDNAFNRCNKLTSINIPDSVTSIGDFAFWGCNSITSIFIPKSVTDIGYGIFSYCNKLRVIEVDSKNAKYSSEENALLQNDCDHPEVYGKELIAGCNTSKIPDSVVSIQSYAFCGLMKIQSIELPPSIALVGNAAIINCPAIREIKEKNPESCFQWHSLEYNVLYSMATESIVMGCKNSYINKAVGNYAFAGSGIKELYLYSNDIGKMAFAKCNKLKKIRVEWANIGEEAFSKCVNLREITVLAEGLGGDVCIAERAFAGCKSLKRVHLGKGVMAILDEAFTGCSSIESIRIPYSVETIGSNPFKNCKNLTSIVVDKINPKYDSRDNCNAIIETATNRLIVGCKNTKIPSSVTEIAEDAFSGIGEGRN